MGTKSMAAAEPRGAGRIADGEAALELMDSRDRSERFASLIATHGALLGRTIRSYARSDAERKDLEQDVALALWRSLPAFRGECSERTFALRVAHNQALTFVDKRRRTPRGSVDVTETEIEGGGLDPEMLAGLSQRMRAVFQAVHRLPFAQRQVLVLALEGLSHDEIAEVVGVTTNNVAVRLSRARAELRKMVDHEG
jgi:RNA polymerase sigma factor (sigma-70 family)